MAVAALNSFQFLVFSFSVISFQAAAMNIVPSETGAAKAVGLVILQLKGKFTGMAFRVPTATVSVIDFTAVLSRNATVEEINAAMKEYAEGPMKGILAYSDEPLVSSDLKGDPHSSIFSALDTLVIGNDLAQVVAWYDNEWGYSMRVEVARRWRTCARGLYAVLGNFRPSDGCGCQRTARQGITF